MLASRLATLRGLDDLGRLFVELGYQPDDGMPEDGLRAVARWKTFRVLALESPGPRDAARGAAHRLAGLARPGLVIALGDGHLAVAAPRLAGPGSSPVLAVDIGAPDPFGLRLLADLTPRPGSTALAHALRVAEALAAEAVGTRFFAAFRSVLDRMSAACGPRAPAADRELAALLALIRVLFLYFVQVKGWLDGKPDFLRLQLDHALSRRRHFHRSVLHPLFFGTLNRPPRDRTHGARFGRIPYLNGGLFEPHPVERRLGPVIFPNALWRDAFDGLFERFRFCVREGADAHAIAPDMLGRVFEQVMAPGERQSSGTFYTPEHLVRRLVIATLGTACSSDRLPPEAVRRLLRGQAVPPAAREAAIETLRAVRVVDPAVGSGAFLLGALEALAAAWSALDPHAGPPPSALRRRIIRENLFGVDLSPIAVRLAELRLWLAVVADDAETDIGSIAPLPNLNGVLRQGDALLDPVSAARAFGLAAGRPAAGDAVRRARDRLFEARGPALPAAAAALRAAETTAAGELLAAARDRTRAAMRDLEAAAQSDDLFGRRSGLSAAQRRHYRRLERRLAEVETARRRAADGAVPFFSFEVHRPDVLAAGGFTAVIGNPPWVRAERLPAGLRETLRDRFRWWRAQPGRGYGHLPDLSVAFLERCLELAAPGGAVGLLVPSKLVSSGYAERARAALVRETSLAYLHRVPDRDARGFGASVYPLAIVIRKAPPDAATRIALELEGGEAVAQTALAAPGPWVLLTDRARAALDTLRAAGTPLGQIAPPALGVKTGADGLLTGAVLEERARVSLVRFGDREVRVERAVLRPALRGRDVDPFRLMPRHVVFWGYDRTGRPLRRLPPLAAGYVESIREALEARGDYRPGGPPWSLFRLRAALARWRVVWSDIAREPAAVALDELDRSAIPLNTCYVAPCPDRETALVAAAVIGSTWTRALLGATADEARGGYRRCNARVTSIVPLPFPSSARGRLAELSRAAHHTPHVSQPDLDRAVADALGLPADARAILADLARDPG